MKQSWEFAHQQLEEGSFEQAALTLERIWFFDHDEQFPAVFEKLGEAHKRSENYDRAAHFYERAFHSAANDRLKAEMLLQKAICRLHQERNLEALSELYQIPEIDEIEFQKRQAFFTAIAAFGAERFDESEQQFKNWLLLDGRNNRNKIDTIEQLFTKVRRIRTNPKTARILSMILPGSGQIYAGDWRNGVNSLLISGGLLFAFYSVGQSTTFYESLLVVFPWFHRYYKGGFEAAEKIAAQRRKDRQSQKYQEILRALE